jgi:hypothetical protein
MSHARLEYPRCNKFIADYINEGLVISPGEDNPAMKHVKAQQAVEKIQTEDKAMVAVQRSDMAILCHDMGNCWSH